ncbi:MAG: molecular chaperone [Escherichia coli]
MRYLNTKNIIAAGVLLSCMNSIAWGAIIPDRTRIIMNESDKGEALKLTNQSKKLPYLAQTWIEDTKGNKSRDFIVTVPPMVRLNPNEQIQIRMITQEKIAQLPKDRETLFYFNVREIPPKTDKKNVMQVTMQHALKLFWRPKAIELEDDGVMTYEKVEIIRRNDGSIRFNNKMPYHVTLGYIGTKGSRCYQNAKLNVSLAMQMQFKNVPSTFVVGYINDFGESFYEINCPTVNNSCNVSVAKRDK